jgi:malonyl-CoA decarboxylase
VPNFAAWLAHERADDAATSLSAADKTALAALDTPEWWRDEALTEQVREPLMRAAAWYFLRAKTKRGTPVDAVARFHLGNGARLERINFLGDTSERALAQAHGLMVNYLYDLDDIEKNHEAFAENRTVVASAAVQRLQRTVELVPVAGLSDIG